jgi:hypothetical protein
VLDTRRESDLPPVIVLGLVSQFAPEDIITVTREKAESKFERHTSAALTSRLKEYSMGEIWERNLIGGTTAR